MQLCTTSIAESSTSARQSPLAADGVAIGGPPRRLRRGGDGGHPRQPRPSDRLDVRPAGQADADHSGLERMGHAPNLTAAAPASATYASEPYIWRLNTLSVSEWTLEAASTAEAIDRVARAGYPAIEIAAVPELDVGAARERLDARGLTVSSMCWIGLGYPERDCAHESERVRRKAGDYLRLCLEQAHALGAGTLVLVPTFRTQPDATGRRAELDRAAGRSAAPPSSTAS